MTPEAPQGKPDLRPFNSAYRDIVLTPEIEAQNRQVGALAAQEYWGQAAVLDENGKVIQPRKGSINRLPRFHIEIPDGRIIVAGKREEDTAMMETSGYDPIADYYGRELMIKGLQQEVISPELARMIAQFKAIEDFLPDYMARATELFRHNEGITASYMQWGNEEKNHSKVAELILLNTRRSNGQIGHMTEEQLRNNRDRLLKKDWELPFPTGRQMVAYAAFQELMTRDAYDVLSKRAREEGAHMTADLLKLVSGDEAYHGGGYMKYLKAYHKIDPAGTVIDTLHVAREFQMPAMNLISEEKLAIKDAIDVGVYGGDYGQGTIEKALRLLNFPEITDEVAADVSKIYGDRIRRMVKIFERRYQRRESGLLVPDEPIDLSE